MRTSSRRIQAHTRRSRPLPGQLRNRRFQLAGKRLDSRLVALLLLILFVLLLALGLLSNRWTFPAGSTDRPESRSTGKVVPSAVGSTPIDAGQSSSGSGAGPTGATGQARPVQIPTRALRQPARVMKPVRLECRRSLMLIPCLLQWPGRDQPAIRMTLLP